METLEVVMVETQIMLRVILEEVENLTMVVKGNLLVVENLLVEVVVVVENLLEVAKEKFIVVIVVSSF